MLNEKPQNKDRSGLQSCLTFNQLFEREIASKVKVKDIPVSKKLVHRRGKV